ncbi:MAG: hypothetical protein UV70_C0002G0056 [Parcubacteria group bacterium GW2011_GWA2_43_13]|nr:MAG: hypothetical protein UV70_C0002G0056 [Parcubacteria group bacterium GW2011_GWA2_43_13]
MCITRFTHFFPVDKLRGVAVWNAVSAYIEWFGRVVGCGDSFLSQHACGGYTLYWCPHWSDRTIKNEIISKNNNLSSLFNMAEDNQKLKTPEQVLIEVQELLERNTEVLQKVKRYLFWAQILGSIKIILIVAPLVAVVYFLPPLIKQFTTLYTNSGMVPNGVSPLLEGLDQYRNLLQ